MKNTKQFYFQNGLSVVLQGLNSMLGEGEEFKPSSDMHRNEADGLWYYGSTHNYLIFNDYYMNIVLAYYDELLWTYRSSYDMELRLSNGRAFQFNSIAECIECLKSGNHDKGKPYTYALSWNYWYNAPVQYQIYTPLFGPQQRIDFGPTDRYYAYYSSLAFNYLSSNSKHGYVEKTLI